MNNSSTNRIAYFDSLRGLAIILIVYSHVSIYILREDSFCYNDILVQFQMPLFFIISGFFFYKEKWQIEQMYSFLKRKVIPLIITPILFMSVFVFLKTGDWGQISHTLETDYWKAGYWFTIALFEFYFFFFIIHLCLAFICSGNSRLYDCLLLVSSLGISLSSRLFVTIGSSITVILGLWFIKHFFFFICGVILKKHYEFFIHLFSLKGKGFLNNIAVVVFITINIISYATEISLSPAVFYYLSGLSGFVIVFSFFYNNQDYFGHKTEVGRFLQLIGKRTLDIYLIHYFFISESNLTGIIPVLATADVLLFNFIFALSMALIIIGCCLVVSKILISSRFIAFCFGHKI